MKKEPIYVTPSTGGRQQQTYADRRAQVANQLSNLPKGHARAKLPKGEYVIETIIPNSGMKEYAKKKKQVVDQTRDIYCTPRAKVEEQIMKRIAGDNEATKRRG